MSDILIDAINVCLSRQGKKLVAAKKHDVNNRQSYNVYVNNKNVNISIIMSDSYLEVWYNARTFIDVTYNLHKISLYDNDIIDKLQDAIDKYKMTNFKYCIHAISIMFTALAFEFIGHACALMVAILVFLILILIVCSPYYMLRWIFYGL